MQMYAGGEWYDKQEKIDVCNPYDSSVIDTVPAGDLLDVERAIASAVRGAQAMRKLAGYERYPPARMCHGALLDPACACPGLTPASAGTDVPHVPVAFRGDLLRPGPETPIGQNFSTL